MKLPEGWEEWVAKIFKEVDTDKSGGVTLEEIGAYIWKQIDTDNDGELSLKEIMKAI